MAKPDYYQVLEVAREASADEIRRSYRRLALKCHPDRNRDDGEAAERFKEVSEAYEVLCDPDRRRIYDQFGHEGLKGRGFGFHDPADIFRDFFEGFGGGIFGDIFGFGGSRRTGPVRGGDIDYRLEITLKEAARGLKRQIEFFRRRSCDHCRGEGAEPGSRRTPCPSCGGAGRVRRTRQTLFGMMSSESACPACGGEGSTLEKPCRKCRGSGIAEELKRMTVEIPPGVYDGLVLRQRQGGEAGARGGPAGDLNLHIAVLPHEIFEREGDDIHCVVPVTMTRAALGGSVSVPTLEGETELKIPPGTQGGEQFRLKGLGIPRLHSSVRGDEMIRVVVETPVSLTAEQKELLHRLEESLGKRNRPSEKSFFDRLRQLVGG